MAKRTRNASPPVVKKVQPKMPQPDNDPLGNIPAPSVPSMLGLTDYDPNSGGAKPTAKGRIDFTQEKGVPGLKHWFGRLYEEFLPTLADDKGRRAYVEMAWNEPTVASFMFAIKMLIRQVTWEVEPADEQQESHDRAAFVDSCLHDLDRPWSAVVAEVLTELIYGWNLQEMVFKVRRGRQGDPPSNHDDGLVGFAKFAPRHQETIWRWKLDPTGKVLGVIQWAPPQWRFTEIEGERLLHFKTDEWHSSPEGLSVLRGAWVPYCFKKSIQTIEMVGIERDCCGIPVAYMPAERMRIAATDTGVAGTEAKKERTDLERLVRDIKTDSQHGIVFPREYDVEGHQLYELTLLSSSGSRAIDCDKSINRYKQEIAGAVLADFLLFGHETTGTQALGRSRKQLFMLAIDAIIDGICGTMNRNAIPLICEANGWEGPFPTLGHQPIDDPDLSTLGPFLTVLGNLGFNLLDEPTERHLRRVADLPVPDIEGGK